MPSQTSASASTVLLSSGAAALGARSQPPHGELRGEIDDPGTGRHWLLFRDPAHPGGPGRLVSLRSAANAPQGPSASASPSRAGQSAHPVIRSGDRVILEEDTPIVESRLEAVALAGAAPGRTLPVRIRIGGRTVEAVALAPGRVALQSPAESHP